MAAALQIWSATYARAFDAMPAAVRLAVEQKVDEMGANYATFAHQRLKGRPECKLRIGDYRVLYEIDVSKGRILLHYIGHRREIYRLT